MVSFSYQKSAIFPMSTYSRLDSSCETNPKWFSEEEEEKEKEDGVLHLERVDGRLGKVSRRPLIYQHWRAFALHVVLVTVNLTVLLALTSGWLNLRHLRGYDHRNSLRDAVYYEKRFFNLRPIYLDKSTPNPEKLNEFNGPPRKELDLAWGELMQCNIVVSSTSTGLARQLMFDADQNVRLAKNELGQFRDDDTLVELADGSGYWSTVSVFHGLHCIERLHHFLYAEIYYPDLSDNDAFTLKRHTGTVETVFFLD
ncbi:hypothetical protein J3459_013565 [Metarhizium acridum]|nr:hypothetical protein J3459_013565 [Metarhizium acridum]